MVQHHRLGQSSGNRINQNQSGKKSPLPKRTTTHHMLIHVLRKVPPIRPTQTPLSRHPHQSHLRLPICHLNLVAPLTPLIPLIPLIPLTPLTPQIPLDVFALHGARLNMLNSALILVCVGHLQPPPHQTTQTTQNTQTILNTQNILTPLHLLVPYLTRNSLQRRWNALPNALVMPHHILPLPHTLHTPHAKTTPDDPPHHILRLPHT